MEERRLSVNQNRKKAHRDKDCKSNLHLWEYSGAFDTSSLCGTIPVKLIACGKRHVIIVAYSFQVFSVGSNESGQLGLGDRVDRKAPREVNFLSEKFVNSISSGPQHCCAISKTGQLFSWGDSRYGQCGQGEKGIFTTPCRVNFEERNAGFRIQDVSCGEQHTLAIDSQGALWSWGSGLATGLGQGDEEILVPKMVTKMSKKRVVQIACGKYHSIALVQDASINQYAPKSEAICSSSSDEGNDALDSHAEKTASVSSSQRDNSTIRDRSISTWSIDTAGSTYEIDRLGSPQLYGISQVWAWGENSHGQLGIGDSTLVIKER